MAQPSAPSSPQHLAPNTQPASGAELFLEALNTQGVEYVFANIGTDYPPIVEAIAKYHREGRHMPRVVICQHEMVALSAAHGYAAATGRPQAVFVHMDVGTQNLGGSVHNAYRARVPAVILAGTSPYTSRGELPGSRSASIQWVQDVPDQTGIIRGYTKLATELRTPVNIPLVVARAFQVAAAQPAGLAYMSAGREVLEQVVEQPTRCGPYPPLSPTVPDDSAIAQLIRWLAEADFPLVVTSYAGRDQEAVAALVELAELSGLGVVEAEPYYACFPTAHPQHAGTTPSAAVNQADLLFVVDCDVPWIPSLAHLNDRVRIAQLDIDAVKSTIPLWDFPVGLSMQGSTRESLRRICALLREHPLPDHVVEGRKRKLAQMHAERHAEYDRLERAQAAEGKLTAWTVSRALDELLGDNGVIVHEAVSNGRDTVKYLRRGPNRLHFGSGGSALGFGGGASLGLKLARPEDDVVFLTGDGNFIFSAPTAVFWGARRYEAPFLTVILNNSGWNAVKTSTLQQHPEGIASATQDFTASFEPPSDPTLVAKAAGAHTITVDRYDELHGALREALDATRQGTAALVDVKLSAKV